MSFPQPRRLSGRSRRQFEHRFTRQPRKSANQADSSRRTAGEQEKSTIRTIYSVCVRKTGSCVTIEFDGDGFLYKMVRLIVGTLVKSALGKVGIEDVAARLNSGQVSTTRFVAPAEGLFLVRVRY